MLKFIFLFSFSSKQKLDLHFKRLYILKKKYVFIKKKTPTGIGLKMSNEVKGQLLHQVHLKDGTLCIWVGIPLSSTSVSYLNVWTCHWILLAKSFGMGPVNRLSQKPQNICDGCKETLKDLLKTLTSTVGVISSVLLQSTAANLSFPPRE